MLSKLCAMAVCVLMVSISDGKSYNMIVAVPECMEAGECPYASPGGYEAIHPNSEERVIHTLRNMARLYPDEFRSTKWGRKKNGGTWKYKNTLPDSICGVAADVPTYWKSGANQATRFHAWSRANCPSGDPGHSTCREHCHVFTDKGYPEHSACDMTTRNDEMVQMQSFSASSADCPCTLGVDRCSCAFTGMASGFGTACVEWLDECRGHPTAPLRRLASSEPIASSVVPTISSSEGLWWHDAYWKSEAHCELVFESETTFHGFGFWPGYESATNIGVEGGPWMSYPLVTGMHTDTRGRFFGADPEKFASFVLLFYGERINDTAADVFLLYQGSAHPMQLQIGTRSKGFWVVDVAPLSVCAPYAFVAVTEKGYAYRLPEDEDLFFGTAWTVGVDELRCRENHYHRNSRGVWRPNEASDSTGNDEVDCIGCDGIPALIAANADPKNYPPREATATANATTLTTSTHSIDDDAHISTEYNLDFADCVNINFGNGFNESNISLKIDGDWMRDVRQYFNKQPVYRNGDMLYLFYSFVNGNYAWTIADELGASGVDIECNAEDVTACPWIGSCQLSPAECGDHSCLSISGGGDVLDGVWTASWPECVNSRSVYTRAEDGPFLCLNRGENQWIVSREVCRSGAESLLAKCSKTRHDPFRCVGDAWGTGTSVQMIPCGESGAFEYETDEETSKYAEVVNVSTGLPNTRLWSVEYESVSFELYADVEWSNGAPVYRFDDGESASYFLHFHVNGTNESGRWLISKNGYLYDYSPEFGVAWCTREHLAECVAGEWTALNVSDIVIEAKWGNETRTQWNTVREVYVDANMAVSMMGQNDGQSEADASDLFSLIVFVLEICLPGLLLCCCAVPWCWYLQCKSGRKGTASFRKAEMNMDTVEIEIRITEHEMGETQEMVSCELR